MAPNGTERHRDQNSDQSGDHATKEDFGHERAAERLLAAVAEGLQESVERAWELVAAVVGDVIVRRAMQVEVLLREGNPLALVRAVELAAVILESNVGRGMRRTERRRAP
ncbi:MAG: hypothetical protein M3020_03565 [Myxococcota bacterium]|nr:hypothetical protein [Myxococcota bacterium]